MLITIICIVTYLKNVLPTNKLISLNYTLEKIKMWKIMKDHVIEFGVKAY